MIDFFNTITKVMNTTLGERVKTRRLQLGLSQVELAKRAHCTQGTIGNLEKEIRKMPRDLLKLAAALQCSPDWLAEGKGPRDLPAPTHHHVAETVKEFHPAWPFQNLKPDDWWKHLDEGQRKHIEDSAIFMLPPARRDSYQTSNQPAPEKGKAAGAA